MIERTDGETPALIHPINLPGEVIKDDLGESFSLEEIRSFEEEAATDEALHGIDTDDINILLRSNAVCLSGVGRLGDIVGPVEARRIIDNERDSYRMLYQQAIKRFGVPKTGHPSEHR